jgi:hypothetical protein
MLAFSVAMVWVWFSTLAARISVVPVKAVELGDKLTLESVSEAISPALPFDLSIPSVPCMTPALMTASLVAVN